MLQAVSNGPSKGLCVYLGMGSVSGWVLDYCKLTGQLMLLSLVNPQRHAPYQRPEHPPTNMINRRFQLLHTSVSHNVTFITYTQSLLICRYRGEKSVVGPKVRGNSTIWISWHSAPCPNPAASLVWFQCASRVLVTAVKCQFVKRPAKEVISLL